MLENPKLYEINTRVWIRKFNKESNIPSLKCIPPEEWDQLKNKGMDIVWLMGIWKNCPTTISKYCFEPGLIRNYEKALRDFKPADVIGSPFAIDNYVVSPNLGDFDDLTAIREELNSRGMKLFLDFVPNHFSADSSVIKTHPEVFLSVDEELYHHDNHTFFKPDGSEFYFAHGRDPFFPAWKDTIQVNYYSSEAVEFMINTILNIAKYCDGIRCDMAMLALDNVYYNTWCGVLNKMHYIKPAEKFWEKAIKRVKTEYPNFIFMAEAYWDLEWEMQQLGFDYTYDKRLTDRLGYAPVYSINEHLMADISYQKKAVRFIENHDEDRAITAFGKHRSMAAAIIISTIPGMRFYQDGQFEGKRLKLPCQLGREFEEPLNKCIYDFYDKLLLITKDPVFNKGNWQLLTTQPSWENNTTCSNILSWKWCYENQNRLVVVNYSDVLSQCRIKLDVRGYEDIILFRDLLHDIDYFRSAEEVHHSGLYIELKPFQAHIFSY